MNIEDVIPVEQRSSSIFIPGEVRSSKNSKQIWQKISTTKSKWRYNGRPVTPFITDSEQCKKYKRISVWHYNVTKSQFKKIIQDKPLPLRVRFVFSFTRNQRCDFTNMVQVVQDMMVKQQWLPDDDMKVLLPVPGGEDGVSVFFIDKENPGVYITVL